MSIFLSSFFLGGGVEIRFYTPPPPPCVDKTLILISTGGMVLMPAFLKTNVSYLFVGLMEQIFLLIFYDLHNDQS